MARRVNGAPRPRTGSSSGSSRGSRSGGRRIGRKLLALLLLGGGIWLLLQADLGPVGRLLDPSLPDSVAVREAFLEDSTAAAEESVDPAEEVGQAIEEALENAIPAADSAVAPGAVKRSIARIAEPVQRWLDRQFVLERVTLEGAVKLDGEELQRRLGRLEGRPIFELDLDSLARELEAHPRVRKARLTRQLPSHLEVVLEERREVVLVAAGGRLLGLDEEGVVLPPLAPGWPLHMPLVTGSGPLPVPGDTVRAGPLVEVLDWLRAARDRPRVQGWLSEVHVEGDSVAWLCGMDGWRVRPGSHGATPQVAALDAFLLKREQQPEQPALVDLRFPGYLIVRRDS